MKKSFLVITLLAVVPVFGQSIPHVKIKAIESRMTDLKSSLFLVDSLYQDYLNGGWSSIQDGSKTDVFRDGPSWLYNQYVELSDKYPRQCPDCKKKADELRQLMDKELRAAAEAVYRNLIKKADEYFALRNFLKAKELYQRAVGFRPSDPYPKDRLKEVEAILAEQEQNAKE